MTKVLVTGATGFLGGALVRSLRADGIDVIATGRNTCKLAMLPVPVSAQIAVDLTDADAMRALVPKLRGATTIVHCAALSSPWGARAAFHAANVTATENVIALGTALGVRRMVHISTPSLYFRFEDQQNVPEDMVLPPAVNHYAATKAMAEERVRSADVSSVILRPRGIYGAGDTALLPRLLRAAQSGPVPLFRQGQACTDITHVSDVVAAIRLAISDDDHPNEGTFNISGGVPVRIKDVIDRVCAINRVDMRWKRLPLSPCLLAVHLVERLARLRIGQPEPRVTAYGLGILAYSQTLDLTAAQQTLGWVPKVSFDEGLALTFPDKAGAT